MQPEILIHRFRRLHGVLKILYGVRNIQCLIPRSSLRLKKIYLEKYRAAYRGEVHFISCSINYSFKNLIQIEILHSTFVIRQ